MGSILTFQPSIEKSGLDLIKSHFHVIEFGVFSENPVIDAINRHQIVGIVTRTEKITEKLLASTPSLKFIAQNGVGVDNIDVDAATKYGVQVLNVPNSNYTAVAEQVVMSVLVLNKKFLPYHQAMKHDDYDVRERIVGTEVVNQRALILGYGQIGQTVARMFKILGIHVTAYDPYLLSSFVQAEGVSHLKKIEYSELKAFDIISVHLPLTEHTHHFINRTFLDSLKESAIIVNTSRGGVVDQNEIDQALKQGKIAGAALDVLESEPPAIDDPILKNEKALLSPHVAGDTREAKVRCAHFVFENIKDYFQNKIPRNLINLNVLNRKEEDE